MLKRIILLFLPILLLPFLVSGQDRASIKGTVIDASEAIVVGAHVRLVSASTGLRRETITGQTGFYEFPALPVGSYDVTVTQNGFKPFLVKGIAVQFAEERGVDARLAVGEASETVQVNATSDVVNTTNAEVGEVIDRNQIKELPISGRNWASLMMLANGAVNYGDGSQRSIRFNGHSLDDSNFTLDGVDISGVQEQTMKSDTRLAVAMDSIAEFRVSTSSYTAETGAAGGAQINVVSKTGTNDMHGSAFYAVRNGNLDARSPFDGATLPPFTLDQFGGSFGGAVIKNKAFYFLNYEGLRQHLGHTFINFVPNATVRAQTLAKSPAMKAILDGYPIGQTPVDAVSDQINLVQNDLIREDAGLARFDYRLNDKNSFYLRYNIDNAYKEIPQDALGTRSVTPVIPQNVAVQWQRLFSPTLINEAKFGWNHVDFHAWNYGTAPVSVSPTGFDGVSGDSVDTEVGTTLSFIDNITRISGRHTFKAGVDIRHIMLDNSGNSITTQSLSYDSTANFISNAAASASYLQGEGVAQNRRTYNQFYFQDEIKVLPTLTLNLGLRYELYTVAHEKNGNSQVVDIYGCGGFCPKGVTPYYDINPNDWGPRAGFAWAPAVFHSRTSLRGGYGLYYGGNQNDDFSDPAESAVPRYSLTSQDFPGLSYPLLAFINPKNQLWSPKAIDRHRKDLYYENWSLMLQQQLGSGFVGQVGYVGSAGHHLFSKYTINLIDPLTGKRPLPTFSSFGLKTNDGNNNYHGLQAQVQRRYSNGLLFQANYLWAHSIGDASIGSGESLSFQNMSCRACDRSSTTADVRHNFTLNSVYELPFGKGKQFLQDGPAAMVFGGWSLSGILSARTGLPVNITMTRKAATLLDQNTSGQRPNYLGGSIYATGQTINSWFNKAAFGTPANLTWGNLGRYAAVGPHAFEIDLTAQRRFRITERVGLNFRASAYNLTNTPIYKTPGSNWSSSSFGRITGIVNSGAVGSGAPRRLEFMIRTEF